LINFPISRLAFLAEMMSEIGVGVGGFGVRVGGVVGVGDVAEMLMGVGVEGWQAVRKMMRKAIVLVKMENFMLYPDE
jgi:hypothetical protein